MLMSDGESPSPNSKKTEDGNLRVQAGINEIQENHQLILDGYDQLIEAYVKIIDERREYIEQEEKKEEPNKKEIEEYRMEIEVKERQIKAAEAEKKVISQNLKHDLEKVISYQKTYIGLRDQNVKYSKEAVKLLSADKFELEKENEKMERFEALLEFSNTKGAKLKTVLGEIENGNTEDQKLNEQYQKLLVEIVENQKAVAQLEEIYNSKPGWPVWTNSTDKTLSIFFDEIYPVPSDELVL